MRLFTIKFGHVEINQTKTGACVKDEIPPDVKQYLSVILYLKDYYKFRKKESSQFSLQAWASELGCVSKSLIRYVVNGQRRISEELTQRFSVTMKLNEVDHEYFSLLVLYSQSSEENQKRIYGRKLTQLLRVSISVEEIQPGLDILSDPLNLIIRNFLTFSDVDRSSETIAKVFLISQNDLQNILNKLQDEKMIELVGNQWIAKHDRMRVNAVPGDESIRSFHKKSLMRAIAAQENPVAERSYRSITLALSEENFKSYQDDVNQFVNQIFLKYDSTEVAQKRIYQINLNSIPWTHPIAKQPSAS